LLYDNQFFSSRRQIVPVTKDSLKTKPYLVGHFNAPAYVDRVLPGRVPLPPLPVVVTRYRQLHTIYPTNLVRNTLTINQPTPGNPAFKIPADARYKLTGTSSVNGDVIYLKYFDDEITSVRLPCPAPAGVQLFVTDTLTGCKFFVDTITGSADLMVYHANTHAHSAGANADCDAQTALAMTQLDLLHTDAVADYAVHGVVLNNVATCIKSTYYGAGGQAERGKRAPGYGQGPTFKAGQAVFSGGCTIVGFPHVNSWRFYYQTYGSLDYSRPDVPVGQAILNFRWNYARKKLMHGLEHAAGTEEVKVFDWSRIY
jgi:hypothetical protein